MKPLPREGFNRSVAKSPFATTYRLRTSLARNKFQSLSREKPFCHDSEIARIAGIDNTFQSLSREKPFCHTGPPSLAHPKFCTVSIAQSRKALLPRRTLEMPDQPDQGFNRSVAKSPFATDAGTGQTGKARARFNRSVAKSPFATSPWERCAVQVRTTVAL